ncbi:hypothetical protein Tco_0108745 [Tanacetum coccineum]
MTKVMKGEFEKIKDVKVKDVSLTCDATLEFFNDDVSRLSKMDDDLFTYEVEVGNIPCDSKMDNDSEQEADDDMGYDPSDIYWIRGDDEVKLTDEESSDDEDDIAEDSKPIKITRMIGSMNGTWTYHGSMRSDGLTLEFGPNPQQLNILASLSIVRLDIQNGQHVVGRMMDTVMEEIYLEIILFETNSIIKITSGTKLCNTYTNYDDAYEINPEHNKSKELCEVHEQPVCNIRRYMMIKYSFNDDEEYVAVKEDKYDDLTVTRKEACRAYQEIFQIMDEG